ncbi:MAG TPA: heparan-alpha-glucosaminide N-acetyltransferase domain-containing protein, partial [Gemmataceae bacterium]|nr:heparan-alpha-glucosaminide N-acetyltransferase domain-containing protein [Gemmataceae bacterium]
MPRPTRRLMGLDQARAVAIIAMIVAHFAPGVFIQLPQLDPVRTPVLWFGRTATPAFVTVFGVTTGFVFLPRFRRTPGGTTRWVLWRAAVVTFAAAVVALPQWVRLGSHGVTDPWEWVFGGYSVLLFYSLALALLPAWLWLLRDQTTVRAVGAGVGLWVVGTAGFHLWPEQSPGGP